MMLVRSFLCITYVVIIQVQKNFAQLVLTPPSLNVDIGYFTMLISQNDGAVKCSIDVAQDSEEEVNLQNNPACLTNPSPSSQWTYSLSQQNVLVNLLQPVQSRLIQVLIISCCDDKNSTTSRAAVDVSADLPVNYSAPAEGVVYPNPAYVNIAPCPCDLTADMCDVNCCCDQVCLDTDLATFSCITGVFGGNYTMDPFELCTSQRFMLPDWHQFMCVQFLRTPDLGLFWPVDINLANDAPSFNVRLSQNPSTFDFDDELPASLSPSATVYSNGSPVLLVLGNSTAYLTLAQRSLSGQCLRSSIVAFQQDSDADCDVTVTQSLCAPNTMLDVNYYLRPESAIVSGAATLNPIVTYSCGNATDYVKIDQPSSNSGRSLFGDGAGSTPVSSACPSASPTISGTSCNNAVVNVTYTMTWNQSSITTVKVGIIMADVPISSETPPLSVTAQTFRVRFMHETDSNLTYLSGNPGYNEGYPVISGSATTAGGIVNTDSTQRLRIWQPASTGLCADSSSAAPPFGKNITTGCLLRLTADDLNTNSSNCSALRDEIANRQQALVANTMFVSRFGNPDNMSTSSDWLLFNRSSLVYNSSATVPFGCPDIPAHLRIQFVTSLTGKILGFPIMEIVAVKASWLTETWTMKCVASGACASDASSAESFSITSSVIFTSIPALTPPSPSLWELRDNTTCEKDATCWPELALPWTGVSYVTMPLSFARVELEYNLAWGLILVLLATGAFLLPLRWYKVGRYIKQEVPL